MRQKQTLSRWMFLEVVQLSVAVYVSFSSVAPLVACLAALVTLSERRPN